MKFWRVIVPNLCISLWAALLTLVILHNFNPTVVVLSGWPFLILTGLTAFCSVACAVTLYGDARRAARRRRRRKLDADQEL